MSRKSKSNRPSKSRHTPPVVLAKLSDVPSLTEPLQLICGPCGAVGTYHVGTVMLNPIAVSQGREVQRAIGFTRYFRCRRCDAGGPWELSHSAEALVGALVLASLDGEEDVPLRIGVAATFDKKPMRYATDGESHLKHLIEKQPDRAFLWVRLGNLYYHSDAPDRAEEVYRRALDLDPADIEGHAMLGSCLMDRNQPLAAVPHLHHVLRYARDAQHVDKDLRRSLVRGSIEMLLEAHATAAGKFDLLPTITPEELQERSNGEPVIIELREHNLGTEEGIEDLCDVFLPRWSGRLHFLRRRKIGSPAMVGKPQGESLRQPSSIGRNDPCPCGSGAKYKKCCGHASAVRR